MIELFLVLVPNFLLWLVIIISPVIVIKVRSIRYPWLKPKGLTFLHIILIEKESFNQTILRHELVHVSQQRRFSPLGLALFMFLHYLYLFIRYRSFSEVYRRSLLEKEANSKMYDFNKPLPRILYVEL